MKKLETDINLECDGHTMEEIEVGDYGVLYRCPYCGKTALVNPNDKLGCFFRFSVILLIILCIFAFIVMGILIFYPDIFNMDWASGMYSEEHEVFQ